MFPFTAADTSLAHGALTYINKSEKLSGVLLNVSTFRLSLSASIQLCLILLICFSLFLLLGMHSARSYVAALSFNVQMGIIGGL